MEIQEHGDGHEETMGTGDQDKRDTETGDGTGQRALLAYGMPEDDKEELRHPERQRMLNACIHQGGEGGGVNPSPRSTRY